MTCYMRNMTWLFETLGLPYDKEHRKLLDTAIRYELDIAPDKHCPEVWSAIKALSEDDRARLVGAIQDRLAE